MHHQIILHILETKSFSPCHHYFLLFSDKKDNHRFQKYVFVHLSINLATPSDLEIFFVTHNGFLCHIFRQWRKIPGTTICYKDCRLIFFKYSLLCWRTSSCIFAPLSIFCYSRPHIQAIKWLTINFSDLNNLLNLKPCKLYHDCLFTSLPLDQAPQDREYILFAFAFPALKYLLDTFSSIKVMNMWVTEWGIQIVARWWLLEQGDHCSETQPDPTHLGQKDSSPSDREYTCHASGKKSRGCGKQAWETTEYPSS